MGLCIGLVSDDGTMAHHGTSPAEMSLNLLRNEKATGTDAARQIEWRRGIGKV